MNQTISNQMTLTLGIISGFIFLAIITPLRIYWRKEALNKIKLAFKDEDILYTIECPFSINFVASFSVGAFFGGFILPFWIFNDVNNIGIVSKTYLPCFFFAEFLSFALIIFMFSVIEVITNKRVKRLSNFSFLNKFMKKLDLLVSDIKSIEYKKCFFIDGIDIWTKNNTFHSLAGYKDIKNIKSCLDNLIEIGD